MNLYIFTSAFDDAVRIGIKAKNVEDAWDALANKIEELYRQDICLRSASLFNWIIYETKNTK